MSEADAHVFSAQLTVCVDFKNPHAYLAKDLVYALEDELEVQADWLPFLMPALKRPTQPQAEDDRGTRHRQHRARYVEQDIQRYARVRGLVVKDIYRPVDSTVAATALLWVRGEKISVRRKVIDGLFAGHWGGGADIAEVSAVTAILEESGVNIEGWELYRAGEAQVALPRMLAGLSAAGLFHVPALVVGEGQLAQETFYGRAHLPMVRWLLEGRNGPAPI
jgi:2-hydroxychromene-2-carboxylate isomerase